MAGCIEIVQWLFESSDVCFCDCLLVRLPCRPRTDVYLFFNKMTHRHWMPFEFSWHFIDVCLSERQSVCACWPSRLPACLSWTLDSVANQSNDFWLFRNAEDIEEYYWHFRLSIFDVGFVIVWVSHDLSNVGWCAGHSCHIAFETVDLGGWLPLSPPHPATESIEWFSWRGFSLRHSEIHYVSHSTGRDDTGHAFIENKTTWFFPSQTLRRWIT